MEKMKMESANITDMNIDKIAALFPNCITETADENGKLKKAINFEMLRAMLSEDIAEGDEAYEFTWVGKKAAIAEANRPIRKTLRPCVEESVNWDTTENLYIEGDNLEVLKLLQESYLGKVKMIYIDPPYNTGNDFIYRDDFAMSSDEYAEESGQFDEDGNRLFKNTDSNGRFHSDWCSMIYSRLMLARNLLAEDGVIYISIDDNEQSNLKEICDEVFGEPNFFAILTRRCMHTVRNSSKDFNKNTDYILAYAKNKAAFTSEKGNLIREKVEKADSYPFDDNDGRGPYKLDPIYARNYARPYTITFKNGIVWEAPEGSYPRYSEEHLREMEINNELDFNGKQPRAKRYLKNVQVGQPPDTLIRENNAGFNLDGTRMLSDVLQHDKVFSQPKPVKLISYLCSLQKLEDDDIILDFFSGSATTAHAVMQLNAEDGGHRKFIMVQLPEETAEDSEAYKAGYKNICEIGKERIRRAGNKILEEAMKETVELALYDEPYEVDAISNKYGKLDIGFRVLKLDETNMQDVYYTPAETTQTMLAGFESNIKPDRTDLDLLFGCLLDWGLPLSMPYSSEQIEGVTVHTYNDGDLIACFDKAIPESVIKTIAKRQPLRVVFRDDSFADSPSKINVSEIFKMNSPDTRVKVI